MLLDWVIINNFLNCANIQISIDVELQFLEQIHNLNFFCEFLKGFNPSRKICKFPKNPSRYELHKSEFSWDHLHVRKGVTIQVSNGVV
jgi:hypothetical protein